MNRRRPIRVVVLALVTSLFAWSVAAQAPQATPPKPPVEFVPEVGQPGKDVIWVPTPDELVEKMLDLARVTPKDYVIDLGSGDGRIVLAAARRGARARGIEYDDNLVAFSNRKAKEQRLSGRASFVKADLFEADFSGAQVVTMFLLPNMIEKLRPALFNLKPGTRIVSNTFDIPEWESDQVAHLEGNDCNTWCTAQLWIVPAKVSGTWRTPRGDLTLNQSFQLIYGTIGTTQIANGRLRGDAITFTAGDAQYSGRVAGKSIKGTVKTGNTERAWTATLR